MNFNLTYLINIFAKKDKIFCKKSIDGCCHFQKNDKRCYVKVRKYQTDENRGREFRKKMGHFAECEYHPKSDKYDPPIEAKLYNQSHVDSKPF